MTKRYKSAHGPFPCYFDCGAALRDKFDHSEIVGWDWFTGYGEETVHFCPKCRKARAGAIAAIRDALNVRPANYPHERVNLTVALKARAERT